MKARVQTDAPQSFRSKATAAAEAGMPVVKMLVYKAVSLLKPVWTKCNERLLGIQTEPVASQSQVRSPGRPWWRGDDFKNAKHDDNFHYATIDYWNARKVARALNPGPEDVFYDIGSGMGRILCIMARRRLRKCVGVELSEPLCQIARRNALKLRGRKAPIEIVCGDAATANLADGTIYFMFNPFGAETLRDTLQNIRDTLSVKPRAIKVVYYNSVHESVLATLDWLERVGHIDSFGGQRITFWRIRHSDAGAAGDLSGAH
jgi:SAM-dependent methyltransferase